MILRMRYARRGDPDAVASMPRDTPFAAVDPGNTGAAIIVADRQVKRISSFVELDEVHEAAAACARWGVRVAIIEEQYVSEDPRAVIRLARTAGIFLGAWTVAMRSALADDPFGELEAVWVPPSMWYAFAYGGGGKREQRKARALAAADQDLGKNPRFAAGSEAVREGVADAWGMCRWWMRVHPLQRIGR